MIPISPGERIVHYLKPFLLHLLEQQLATKTLRRHRDNIWLLGGELIHEDGGPFIYPRITEPEQESFDATCRKLYRFVSRNNGSAWPLKHSYPRTRVTHRGARPGLRGAAGAAVDNPAPARLNQLRVR